MPLLYPGTRTFPGEGTWPGRDGRPLRLTVGPVTVRTVTARIEVR